VGGPEQGMERPPPSPPKHNKHLDYHRLLGGLSNRGRNARSVAEKPIGVKKVEFRQAKKAPEEQVGLSTNIEKQRIE